jgi:hypothetical protein
MGRRVQGREGEGANTYRKVIDIIWLSRCLHYYGSSFFFFFRESVIIF